MNKQLPIHFFLVSHTSAEYWEMEGDYAKVYEIRSKMTPEEIIDLATDYFFSIKAEDDPEMTQEEKDFWDMGKIPVGLKNKVKYFQYREEPEWEKFLNWESEQAASLIIMEIENTFVEDMYIRANTY